MEIIVAGSLIIKQGCRDDFIDQSKAAIEMARNNDSCLDFSVSADSIDANRVNIFEKWTSRAALVKFRNNGSKDSDFSLIKSFHVNEYDVTE